MKTNGQQTSAGRRRFLQGAALIGGTTVLLAAGRSTVWNQEETPAPESSVPPESKGYRVTPHVQTYYEKARL